MWVVLKHVDAHETTPVEEVFGQFNRAHDAMLFAQRRNARRDGFDYVAVEVSGSRPARSGDAKTDHDPRRYLPLALCAAVRRGASGGAEEAAQEAREEGKLQRHAEGYPKG